MSKKIPMRMCVGCREMKEKREMIRVIKTADGDVLIDLTGKKNGRGAYLCKNAECMKLAVKNHGLERSFQTGIPKDTVEELMREMETIAK